MRMHALFSSGSRFSRALLLVGLILFLCVSARAVASEIVILDHEAPFVARMSATKAGDRFVARLTAPVTGNVVGVQLFWGSSNGGAQPSQETAIRILAADGPVFENTTIPQPGTALATIASPVLVDLQRFGSVGTPNEFRFLDPGTNQVSVNVPLMVGQAFYIELELANVYPLSGPLAGVSPSLYMSATGFRDKQYQSIIHAPDNPNYARPPASYWHEIGEPFSISASWGIRAIIQPVPEPSTYALAAIGVVALLAVRRRKWAV